MQKVVLLSHEIVLRLYHTASGLGLASQRIGLLSGLSPSLVAQLPQATAQSEQLLSDLCALNAIRSLPDGTVPLSVWLKNAAALTLAREEASVFAEALAELPLTTDREPNPRLPPPQVASPADSLLRSANPSWDRRAKTAVAVFFIGAGASLLAVRWYGPHPSLRSEPLSREPPAVVSLNPPPPWVEQAAMRGVGLTLEAQHVLSFDLLDLNRIGVHDVIAGEKRYLLRPNGLQMLELRSEDGHARVELIAGSDGAGQSVLLRPQHGTLVTRIGLTNDTDTTLEGAIELYLASTATAELLHDASLRRVEHEQAHWEIPRLSSLRLLGGALEARR